MQLTSFVVAAVLSLGLPLFAVADNHGPSRRHSSLAQRKRGDVLEKRFSGGQATWFDVGLGACGKNNVPSDFIVALNTPQYGSGYPGPNCFRTITIQALGKTAQATIMDQCPGCGWGSLDMSTGLFQHFASLGTGVFPITWFYNDDSSSGGGGGGGGDDTTTKKTTTTKKATSTWTPPPAPTTTKTKTKTTTTSTWTPDPTTTSEKKTSTTSSWTSTESNSTSWSQTSTSKSKSTSTSTPLPTPSADPVDSGNVADANQLILGLAELVVGN